MTPEKGRMGDIDTEMQQENVDPLKTNQHRPTGTTSSGSNSSGASMPSTGPVQNGSWNAKGGGRGTGTVRVVLHPVQKDGMNVPAYKGGTPTALGMKISRRNAMTPIRLDVTTASPIPKTFKVREKVLAECIRNSSLAFCKFAEEMILRLEKTVRRLCMCYVYAR